MELFGNLIRPETEHLVLIYIISRITYMIWASECSEQVRIKWFFELILLDQYKVF